MYLEKPSEAEHIYYVYLNTYKCIDYYLWSYSSHQNAYLKTKCFGLLFEMINQKICDIYVIYYISVEHAHTNISVWKMILELFLKYNIQNILSTIAIKMLSMHKQFKIEYQKYLSQEHF